MNKLLVMTVLVAFLALSAESFRMPRQAEEEQGYLNKVIDSFRSYYEKALDSARNLYTETAEAVVTYTRVGVDQAYYYMYPQQ